MADDGEGAVLHAANIEDLFQESLRSNGMVHGNEYICTSILGNKKTPRTQFPKNSVVRPGGGRRGWHDQDHDRPGRQHPTTLLPGASGVKSQKTNGRRFPVAVHDFTICA
jgi:hypothetical protein